MSTFDPKSRRDGLYRACSCLLVLSLVIHVSPQHASDSSTFSHYTNYFAVRISGGDQVATRVARSFGLINRGQVGDVQDHYLFEHPRLHKRSAQPSRHHHHVLQRHPEVLWFEQQRALRRKKRDLLQDTYTMTDPLYRDQWYLHHGGAGGFDLNVAPAWRKGYSGKNIVISILDDGIERDHPDLIKNYDPYASYDVNDHDSDPIPRYDPTDENRHGTRCAGEVSAAANNSACGVGIAFDSKIGGVRMLDGDVYDAVEAASLSFNRSHIDIYSASWGPDDDGRVVDGPGPLAKRAFEEGIQSGRNKKGSIYVWASGNGGSADDSCNCDGYTNSIYTLSISSCSEHGTKPWYLEECASTLATTYSSGSYNEKQIVTVDLHHRCTETHTGTSASAPLAAGIVALALEANPSLTWRDVQYLTLMSANPAPLQDGQWVTNALGRKVSLRYGYGLMDAAKMVELAEQWTTVPEKHICEIKASDDNVPLVSQMYSATVNTNGCQGTANEVRYLEHVQARITLNFYYRGSAVIHLTSPSGTRSMLLPHRPNDGMKDFKDWPFLSVHFWGEQPQGEWKLEVEDVGSPRTQNRGTLTSWSLVLHGTATQPVNLRNSQPDLTTAPPTSPPLPSSSPASTAPTSPHTGPCHTECKGGCRGPAAKDCEACQHFRLAPKGDCVVSCPDGYYAAGQVCGECYSSCLTCHGPTLAECDSCSPGAFFLPTQHICLQQCPIGTMAQGGQCLECANGCLECPKDPQVCSRCPPDAELQEGRCVPITAMSKRPGQKSYNSLVAVVVVVCLLTASVLILVVVLLYARSNQLLCWSYRYDKLPSSDDSMVVRLTAEDYRDEDDLS